MRNTLKGHLSVAKGMLTRANKSIKEKDPIQASEKIYKSVEECIKILAILGELPEYKKAKVEGRWWSKLLEKAAVKLAEKYKEKKIFEAWAVAFNLHIWGYHECALNIKEVKYHLPCAKWLLEFTENKLKP